MVETSCNFSGFFRALLSNTWFWINRTLGVLTFLGHAMHACCLIQHKREGFKPLKDSDIRRRISYTITASVFEPWWTMLYTIMYYFSYLLHTFAGRTVTGLHVWPCPLQCIHCRGNKTRHDSAMTLRRSTLCLKKGPTLKLPVTLSNLNRFSKILHYGKPIKFATKPIRNYPPHLRHIATLPWEIKNSNFLQMWKKMQKVHF